MTVNKKVNGHTIELIMEKIEDHAREYSMYDKYAVYQVSKMVNGEKVPLYKECFSDFDIQRIENNGYKLDNYCDDEYNDRGNIDVWDDDELERLLSI